MSVIQQFIFRNFVQLSLVKSVQGQNEQLNTKMHSFFKFGKSQYDKMFEKKLKL